MKQAYVASPFYVVIPILYWIIFRESGFPMQWAAFGIGAAGWWIAYLLRIPVSLILKKWTDNVQTIVYFSGPLEEGVRLVTLLFIGFSLRTGLSIGQGWAAIEVVFTVVNLFVLTSIKYRIDDKAIQAQEILRSSGVKLDGSPFWGVMERIFANAFHIGSTLLIAWNPWLTLIMIPTHTIYNLTLLRLLKKSIALAESVVALLGTVIIVAGWLVYSL